MRQDNYKNSRPEPSTREGSGPAAPPSVGSDVARIRGSAKPPTFPGSFTPVAFTVRWPRNAVDTFGGLWGGRRMKRSGTTGGYSTSGSPSQQRQWGNWVANAPRRLRAATHRGGGSRSSRRRSRVRAADAATRSRCAARTRSPAAPADRAAAYGPDSESVAPPSATTARSASPRRPAPPPLPRQSLRATSSPRRQRSAEPHEPLRSPRSATYSPPGNAA